MQLTLESWKGERTGSHALHANTRQWVRTQQRQQGKASHSLFPSSQGKASRSLFPSSHSMVAQAAKASAADIEHTAASAPLQLKHKYGGQVRKAACT